MPFELSDTAIFRVRLLLNDPWFAIFAAIPVIIFCVLLKIHRVNCGVDFKLFRNS